MTGLFTLAHRTALITGGSRGIGRMIAAGFLKQGARVYISSRKAADCDATAKELSSLGECFSLPADVSTLEGVNALVAAYAARETKLDILVNNAGAAWGESFDTFPEKGWDKVVDLNLKAPFFLTQALHGLLKAAASAERPAKVINIASIDGIAVNPQETYSYAASKSGLIHMTRRMALRLAQDDIVVSAIAPGAFASDMNRAARDHGDEIARRIPCSASAATTTWPAPPSTSLRAPATTCAARRWWSTAASRIFAAAPRRARPTASAQVGAIRRGRAGSAAARPGRLWRRPGRPRWRHAFAAMPARRSPGAPARRRSAVAAGRAGRADRP